MIEVKNDEKLYAIQVTYPFPGLDQDEQEYDSFLVKGKDTYERINSELETLIKSGAVFDVDEFMSRLKDQGNYVEKIEEFYLHIADDNQ